MVPAILLALILLCLGLIVGYWWGRESLVRETGATKALIEEQVIASAMAQLRERWGAEGDVAAAPEPVEPEEEDSPLEDWQDRLRGLSAPGLQGLDLVIQYDRGSRPGGFRKLRADKLMHEGGEVYLFAHCFRAGQRRNFAVEAIGCVVDPETKEEWPTLGEWLEAKGVVVDWSVVEES